MKEKLRQRLSELEEELQKGEQMLADLRARENDLQQSLLRIVGAVQVLREMLDAPAAAAG